MRRCGEPAAAEKCIDSETEISEIARIEAVRHARLDKHPSMRRLVAGLSVQMHFLDGSVAASSTQNALAQKVGWSNTRLSEYMTG